MNQPNQMKLRDFLPNWLMALFVRDIVLVESSSKELLLTTTVDPELILRNGWALLTASLTGGMYDYYVELTFARKSVKESATRTVSALELAFEHRDEIRKYRCVTLRSLASREFPGAIEMTTHQYIPSY